MADKEFEQEFLDAHNAYRAMHGAPPLTYNSQMCNEAQKWAERCLHSQTLGHSETKDGENVFCKSGFPTVKITGKEAVDAWYSEIKDYTFTPPRFSPKTGKDVVDAWWMHATMDHNLEPSLFQNGTGQFSQVVWKNSKELGLGMATDGKKAFVVGLYRPPGNYVNAGQFETNVLPKVDSEAEKSSFALKTTDEASAALGQTDRAHTPSDHHRDHRSHLYTSRATLEAGRVKPKDTKNS